MRQGFFRASTAALSVFLVLAGGGLLDAARADRVTDSCNNFYYGAGTGYTYTESMALTPGDPRFPVVPYTDELVGSVNLVTSAEVYRTVTESYSGFITVGDGEATENLCTKNENIYSAWSSPATITGQAVAAQEKTQVCLESYKMTLAGPLEPGLTTMPEVPKAFPLDSPALLTFSSGKDQIQTTYGQDPDTGWRDCAREGDAYNQKSPDFLDARRAVANGNWAAIPPKDAKLLMAYQGRYKVATTVDTSQITFRSYPNHWVYGQYAGQTILIDSNAEPRRSTVSTWMLRDCNASRTLSGSLLGGDIPYAKFQIRNGVALSLTEEAEWMKANCPNPETNAAGEAVQAPIECSIVSKEDGTTDVIASPIYRSRSADTNANLGSYRGYSDWISPSTADSVFEVKADNNFVWADFLRYADVDVRLAPGVDEIYNNGVPYRKWSTIMALSARDGQNSPSLEGTSEVGGPGASDDGQPYHVAKQTLKANGDYTPVAYGQAVGPDGRVTPSKYYDSLALNSWYGPTSVFNFDEAESSFFPGFMVAFGAASQQGAFWGVQPRWAVSSLVNYTKEMPTQLSLDVVSASSILVDAAGSTNESVTEVLFSDSCDATRQARFRATVPSVVG